MPGLYKIFDEIIVNAADNKIRDASMDTIKVDFDRASNTVSVYNNGRGIPIEMHSVSAGIEIHVLSCTDRKNLHSGAYIREPAHQQQLRR